MSYIRTKTIEGLEAGDSFTVMRTFMEEDMLTFAEISRDYNPVHFDERFAQVKKLSGRICHGLLVASMLTEIGGQIGWLAAGMDLRFKGPVYFGDTIRCVLTITEIDHQGRARAEAIFSNQDGDTVLQAVITGFVPESRERRIMAAMLSEGDPTNKIT